MFRSSLIASSRAQNLTPSMIASTPVFLPGVALLSNSFVSMSLPSILKIALPHGYQYLFKDNQTKSPLTSFTRLAFTSLHPAGVNPVKTHSLTPYGALTAVALAASI